MKQPQPWRPAPHGPTNIGWTATAARSAGWMLALILSIQAVYAVYLCLVLQTAGLDQRFLQIAAGRTFGEVPPYAALLATVQFFAGSTQESARGLSVVCMLAITLLAFNIGRRAAGDPVCGAGLTLPFVLFPGLAATYSLATPHALVAMLALAIVHDGGCTDDAAVTSARRTSSVLKLILLALGIALLHPLGGMVGGAALGVAGAMSGWTRTRLIRTGLAGAAIVAVAATGISGTIPDEPDFVYLGHNTVVTAVIMPFAMLWVGIILGGMALLRSPGVRERLGPSGRACAVSATGAAVMLMAAVGLEFWQPGQALTGIAYLFPLAALGWLPAIVWIRWVMPTIRSFWVWVLLPVVMYSCFWMVLGPNDPLRFPYGARMSVTEAS